jgi:hypothetical protein
VGDLYSFFVITLSSVYEIKKGYTYTIALKVCTIETAQNKTLLKNRRKEKDTWGNCLIHAFLALSN